MSNRICCRVENVVVPAEHRKTLEDLIFKLFERRHHNYVAGQEHDWLTVELVQSLRRESELYRQELSTKTSGPLPFALGFFRFRDDALELTTDKIPGNVDPKTLVRLLSEFVEPGARFWFGAPESASGWEVRGTDNLIPMEAGPESDS